MTARSRILVAAVAVALAALAGLTVVLVGGGGGSRSDAAGDRAVAGPPDAVPVEVAIPALDVRSTLIPLGVNQDGTVEVPPVTEPMQAGWYEHGPTPGELGPAVLLGHVDGNGVPGVFHGLARLAVGDRIEVTRSDRTVASFVVRETVRVAKDRFPTQEVYGETTDAQLRLITCGGAFDEQANSYRDNVIVYADLAADS